MQKNKKNKHFSLKFAVFIIVLVTGTAYYISIPYSHKDISKNKTFEEQLEVSKSKSIGYNTASEFEYGTAAPPKFEVYNNETGDKNTPDNTVQNSVKLDDLLNQFKNYPANSIHFVEVIVDKIVVFLGYPSGSVKVLSDNLDKGNGKVQGSYMAAYFDIASGCIYVDSRVLYTLDSKLLISILFHELDHFDKMAKTAKSMGYSEFVNLLESKNISGINKNFWSNASRYADLSGFDARYYQDAFKRLISQHELELTSSYSDFYKLSENMRNPLEISAYNISNYIENYYHITKSEGPMRRLTKKFNEVDWAVYNFISSDEIIKTERIALFDYFFMQAVTDKFPELKPLLDECINNRNGDLTAFWLEYEKQLADFYIRGRRLNSYSYNIIMELLTKTEEYAKHGASYTETANALKYKANTIIKNIVYPNAIKNIKMTSEDYLKFIKEKNISAPADELSYIIVLICIENELYSNNNSAPVELSPLKIPEVIATMYPPVKKRNKFYFIFDNPAFKKQFDEAKQKDEYLHAENYLRQLIEKNRLIINIKP